MIRFTHSMIERHISSDGIIHLSGPTCSYTIQRLRPGVLFLAIAGKENGELGRAPLGEVAVEAALHPPIRLFIDMNALTSVDTKVSEDWTAWFRANKQAIRKVDVLAPSTLVRLTVVVSQMFSGLGNLLQIHPSAGSLEQAVQAATAAPSVPMRLS